jgi:hypothetical protein
MSEYKVFSGETLVGYSALELGDPPMGVALGKFFPLAAYGLIQVQCIAARDLPQSHLDLSIARQNGNVLPVEHGVVILDYSVELGEIEVQAVGIGYPLYGELFPQQVATYKAQFG